MSHEPVKSNLPFIAGLCLLGLFAIILCALTPLPARAQPRPGLIDNAGFAEPTSDLAAYRQTRLIGLDTFNAMKADPETIVIDARSASSYALGHIKGAVNLDFSDISAGMLSEIIGSKQRRILIYCHTHVAQNVDHVLLKSSPLALKVPTFFNLYSYGFENIYELSGTYCIEAAETGWTSHPSVQEN
jgi:hypothetical protein